MRSGSTKSANDAAKCPKIVPFPPRSRRDREEIAFLPAALEIIESPPSPTGRAIGLIIITLVCLAVGWAGLGKVDIVASAPGQIITSGRTKTIQPFETGVVRAIHVRDGQAVRAGDVLIELDPTMYLAERDHLKSDLTAAQLDIARLRAALSDVADPTINFHPPVGAPPQLATVARQLLIDQVAQQRSKIAALDKQLAQKEAERSTTAATISKLEATIPVVQQRVDIYSALYNREFGSKLQYLQSLQQLIEQQQDVSVQRSRLNESEAAIAGIVQTREQTIAEFHSNLLDALNKAEVKAAGLVEDVAKAEQRVKFQKLAAPVDGVVQQLAIHTIGGVVTPAQALLVLVPEKNHLEVEAMISNHDIGFVHPGQDVEIKVDTFNFTRYGLLHGKVISVSRDAIARDKPNAQNVNSANNASSEPKGQELSYSARVSLDRTQMQIDDNLVDLGLGMAVTVEIKTGERSVLSYLFSPILRYKHDTMRER
ncbi:HlyD family type I secretion periplasmic adaptor subunit [Bradyrhizobium sp. STM 3562]|uniref:HlyD family type I secretion periplasmic adaptor subunit n=1 Tax=Bradyrhizobium sp. STM 3562 TaxID=578924 RepID=UPI00388FC3AC